MHRLSNTIIILCLMLLVNVECIQAQMITKQDQLKYWHYRQRFLSKFIIIGEAKNNCEPSGLSLPAQVALMYRDKNDKYVLSWLDNPAQMLGYYIGVVATELKLLYLYGYPYKNTQRELYYAMKAYERLDRNCECLFYPKDPKEKKGVVNGLFCRDDVPIQMMYDKKDGGKHTAWRDKNGYHEFIFSNYKEEVWDIETGKRKFNDITLYPSSEEWAGLVTGFALVVEALADCPSDVVIYNNYRFVEEAILNTQRFMDWYQQHDWIIKLTNGETVRFGEDPMIYQGLYGFAKAADFICSAKRRYRVPLRINPVRNYSAQFPYKRIAKSVIGNPFYLLRFAAASMGEKDKPPRTLMEHQQFFWLVMGDPESKAFSIKNAGEVIYRYLILDECPQNWICHDGKGLLPSGNYWAATTAYNLAAIGDSWQKLRKNEPAENITFESLLHYTSEMHWEFYPLLNLYLHHKQNEADQMRRNLITDLHAAPMRGPHYHPRLQGDPSPGVPGWRAHFKWTGRYDPAYLGKIDTVGPKKPNGAEYNGVDYMLAYNLLWLDCLQKGLVDEYFAIDKYLTGKDLSQNISPAKNEEEYLISGK